MGTSWLLVPAPSPPHPPPPPCLLWLVGAHLGSLSPHRGYPRAFCPGTLCSHTYPPFSPRK